MACCPDRVKHCFCGCSLYAGSVLIAVFLLLESVGDLLMASQVGDDAYFMIINFAASIAVNAIAVVVG